MLHNRFPRCFIPAVTPNWGTSMATSSKVDINRPFMIGICQGQTELYFRSSGRSLW